MAWCQRFSMSFRRSTGLARASRLASPSSSDHWHSLTSRSISSHTTNTPWTKKPRKSAEARDAQMKLEYPPFELPDASQLRLTRRLVDVDEYLANIQQSSDKVTAFDMEWNVSFKAGQERRTGMIQIAHREHGYLLYSVPRGYYQELPPSMRVYLADAHIAKVGLNIKNDMNKLTRDWPAADFTFNHVIDLSDMAKLVDRPLWLFTTHVISLQELTGVYLRRYLSKSARSSTNWESLALDAEPLQYAAGDTLASLELYAKLLQLAQEKNVDLQKRHVWSSRDKLSIMGSKLTKDQMTPRQLEAWVLTFASQDFDVEAAARDMGIKPSSVSKYLLEGLSRETRAYEGLEGTQLSQLVSHVQANPKLGKQYAGLVDQLQAHLQRLLPST